jgi:PAS domain S-box-containing protein
LTPAASPIHHHASQVRPEVILSVMPQARPGASSSAEGDPHRALLDAVDLGAILVDADGLIRSWNRGAAELCGWEAAEVVGRPVSLLYPAPDGEDLAAAELAEARHQGKHEVNGWRVRREGSRFWAHSVLASVGQAGFTLVLGRRRFGFLDQVSSMLATTLDPMAALEHLSRLVVPYLADFCAVDLAEVGRPLRRAAYAHVDGAREELLSRDAVVTTSTGGAPARVLQTGRSELIAVVTPQRLAEIAGSEEEGAALARLAPGSLLLVPLTARGRVLGVLTLATAADRKYAAEDQAMAEELGRRAGVALDNARLHEEAQLAVRARDEFLSVASHELRTPLTTIQINIQALLRVVLRGELDPVALGRKLGSAEEQVRRLGRLMDELLDTSRITAGRLEIELSTVRLDQVAREVLVRHEDELQLAGIEVRTHLEPVSGTFDAGRMEQVIGNLLTNAIKYAAGRPLDLSLSRVRGRAVLSMRDHGPGIPREDQARIFERFQRGAGAGRRSGLGLGLFIVRQIVAAHGGTIQVVSEPGQGATFIVVLPAGT